MAETAKRALLKIKKQGEIYNLFVKSNARNVDCVDAAGTKTTLKAALAGIYGQLDAFAASGQEHEATMQGLQEQISGIIENSDPEALDSLREIAAWIAEHEDEYGALAQLVAGIPEDKTVKEYIDESIFSARSDLAADISSSESRLSEKIEEAVPTLLGDDAGKALVNRNGTNSWEELVQIADNSITEEEMQEGTLYCVILQDDPTEVTQANILEVMADCDNIVLTEDVTIPKGTEYDGTINANGFTITLEE